MARSAANHRGNWNKKGYAVTIIEYAHSVLNAIKAGSNGYTLEQINFALQLTGDL